MKISHVPPSGIPPNPSVLVQVQHYYNYKNQIYREFTREFLPTYFCAGIKLFYHFQD